MGHARQAVQRPLRRLPRGGVARGDTGAGQHADDGGCASALLGGRSQLRLVVTDQVIWRGSLLCEVSRTTWPAKRILFNALGETFGQQGRWEFGERDGYRCVRVTRRINDEVDQLPPVDVHDIQNMVLEDSSKDTGG